MQVLEVRRNVLVEAVGGMWAAFSPASGETQLLNDEAAAFIEVLSEAPQTIEAAAQVIALESAVPIETVLPLLEDAAMELETAGLIQSVETLQSETRPANDRAA